MEEGWRTFREALKESWNNVFRYGCYFAIFEFLALAAGFGIWMIFQGLWMIGLRLAIYWKPARVWLMGILRVQDERYLQMPSFAWHRLVILIIYFPFASLLMYVGTRILIEQGFLRQNLIYMALSHQ